MSPLRVTPPTARRFMRRALLLDEPAPDIATALNHHGYIQIDPLNVCGRMHDLILRNRVRDYGEGGLMRHLHGGKNPLPAAQRTAFEHHLPSTGILVAFPLDAWPHLLAANATRTRRTSAWSGRLTPRERELSVHLLAEIAARGPLGSEDFDDERRARRVWGAMRLAKSTLQKLFFHGRLLIARRGDGHRRLYDLPERVLPPFTLAAKEPSRDETDRWLVLITLRQRRLVLLKKKDLPLVADLVQAVQVEGCPTLHCLRSDLPLFELLAAPKPGEGGPAHSSGSALTSVEGLPAPSHLLAPLDPLIYDRRVTSALWGFDYTWEAYTPPTKRLRGYYALPVLAGLEQIGHVDPKADRKKRRLQVVSRRIRRGHQIPPAVKQLAAFLGLK